MQNLITNLEARRLIVAMNGGNPVLAGDAEKLSMHITQLTVALVQAADALSGAARQHPDDPALRQNAAVIRELADAAYDDGRGEGDY